MKLWWDCSRRTATVIPGDAASGPSVIWTPWKSRRSSPSILSFAQRRFRKLLRRITQHGDGCGMISRTKLIFSRSSRLAGETTVTSRESASGSKRQLFWKGYWRASGVHEGTGKGRPHEFSFTTEFSPMSRALSISVTIPDESLAYG